MIDKDRKRKAVQQRLQGPAEKTDTDGMIPCILQTDGSSKGYLKNWARLIQKIYEVDPLTCPKCHGPIAIIAFIEAEEVIEKILNHLGLWEVKPRPPPRIGNIQPVHSEPWIDYAESQAVPSDNGRYVRFQKHSLLWVHS